MLYSRSLLVICFILNQFHIDSKIENPKHIWTKTPHFQRYFHLIFNLYIVLSKRETFLCVGPTYSFRISSEVSCGGRLDGSKLGRRNQYNSWFHHGVAVAARDGRTETFPLCSLRSHDIMPLRLAVPLGEVAGGGLRICGEGSAQRGRKVVVKF